MLSGQVQDASHDRPRPCRLRGLTADVEMVEVAREVLQRVLIAGPDTTVGVALGVATTDTSLLALVAVDDRGQPGEALWVQLPVIVVEVADTGPCHGKGHQATSASADEVAITASARAASWR